MSETWRSPHFPEVSFRVTNGWSQLQLCQMVLHMDIHLSLVISRYPAALPRSAMVQVTSDSLFVENCGGTWLHPTGCCIHFTQHSGGSHIWRSLSCMQGLYSLVREKSNRCYCFSSGQVLCVSYELSVVFCKIHLTHVIKLSLIGPSLVLHHMKILTIRAAEVG